jgi:hypothetical protein
MKNKKNFYIKYAEVACKISSSPEWKKYLKKLYSKSSILNFSETKPNVKIIANLQIKELNFNEPELKFITHKNDLLSYVIETSKHPLFFFPTVHQLLARIFNILFHLNGGFVLHASSLLIDNNVFIFSGESGRGKSTIVDILKNKFVHSMILSDNSAFISKEKSSFVLYPSPYMESNRIEMIQQNLSNKKPFNIKAVYFPFHSKKNTVDELTFSEKISLIQKNSHIPYQSSILFEEKTRKQFAKIIFAFVGTQEIYKLNFTKSSSFRKKLSLDEK